QMLMGMLDAALARQQDCVREADRVTVALKVDEAPLVINRGFAETLALKRSAGLETTACWQTDSQWIDRDIRTQLDALFAHRVYFATASVADARASAALLMAEFSDSVRPGNPTLSPLGRPDARLHLPKHHAIVSFTTPAGRQSPFVAQTLPMHVDPERILGHSRRQAKRGGRYLADLRQPHWERASAGAGTAAASVAAPVPAPPPVRHQPRRMAGRTHGEPGPAALGCAHHGAEPADTPPPPADTPPAAVAVGARPPDAAVREPGKSYRELVDLDGAHRVRAVVRHAAAPSLSPDALDTDILRLVASFRFALSSQIHRRFNDGRAVSTTQRRLKRLSDSGLLDRLQFHRRDGAGVPMCYAVAEPGERLLGASGRVGRDAMPRAARSPTRLAHPDHGAAPGAAPLALDDERTVAQIRHEVHVLGWAIAFERTLAGAHLPLRGAQDSVLTPPSRRTPAGERSLGLADLRLAGGRTPHDFWRVRRDGGEDEVGRFESLRPDATITLPAGASTTWAGAERGDAVSTASLSSPAGARAALSPPVDLLVELDDRLASAGGRAKLERYDHFLAGWATLLKRYRNAPQALPVVVFVCRDRERARECARQADGVLRACQAYAGEYPAEWLYPARRRVLFCAEPDIHAGSPLAYGVPALPPRVRAERGARGPLERAGVAEPRSLPAHP
ncbi:MAG: replication-relaxation family protein, partial [Solirubrobacteraceae bacterium]